MAGKEPAHAAVTETSALRYGVQRLARRLRTRSGEGLTASMASALSTIQRHGEIRVGELARREQVSKSTITRQVAKLEAGGLVNRIPDPDDGRVFIVTLTSAGEQVLVTASARQDEYLGRQLEALDPGDREKLRQAIPVIERLLEIRA